MKKYSIFAVIQPDEEGDVVPAKLAEEMLEVLKENLDYFENLAMDFDAEGLPKTHLITKIKQLQSIIAKAEEA